MNMNTQNLPKYTFTVTVTHEGRTHAVTAGFTSCSRAMAYAKKVYPGLNYGVVATALSV